MACRKAGNVSGASKVIREATNTVDGRDGTANILPQKRPITESQTETRKIDLKITDAANRLKKSKALKGNSVLVAKESSAKERKSKGIMITRSSPSFLKYVSSSPAHTKPGKLRNSGKEVLNSFFNVSNTVLTTEMTTGGRSTENISVNVEETDDLLAIEETDDLLAIEAKKRLRREKYRNEALDKADGLTLSLTSKGSILDDVHVDLPKHIFDSAFMEKIRVFSEVIQMKWYQINSEPLPNYAELADKFGQNAAFDHGNLFKAIKHMPHYRGLDISDTGLLEDLWYKIPLLFESLHKSFKSQRYLVRNIEIMREWLTKLAQAGFDVSVPYAAFDLLTVSPADFAIFQKSLDSVNHQLSEEQQNVEALKSKLPVSEKLVELDSKLENLKQQLVDLELERLSLEPLRSVELEFEKHGTSTKAWKLETLKELYEKKLTEAEQFLREVSLDGWYRTIGEQ